MQNLGILFICSKFVCIKEKGRVSQYKSNLEAVITILHKIYTFGGRRGRFRRSCSTFSIFTLCEDTVKVKTSKKSMEQNISSLLELLFLSDRKTDQMPLWYEWIESKYSEMIFCRFKSKTSMTLCELKYILFFKIFVVPEHRCKRYHQKNVEPFVGKVPDTVDWYCPFATAI